VSGPLVKWRSDLRQWRTDPSGVTIEEARAHGYRGLPRTVGVTFVTPTHPPRLRWRAPRIWLLIGATAAMAAAKAKRLAVARERRRQYFAGWWLSVGKDRRRLKREAAPAVITPAYIHHRAYHFS
jgi:hypothetical protein